MDFAHDLYTFFSCIQNQQKVTNLEKEFVKQNTERSKLLTEQGRLEEEAEVLLFRTVMERCFIAYWLASFY